MVDQLNRFAGEVTRVAREVGVEGKLGGQAQSRGGRGRLEGPHRRRQPARGEPDQPGARDRRGGDRGDRGRPDAAGHASRRAARSRVLKDLLNEMIRNLRETMRQNTEQDWLKTNLERFTRMLQGQRDLATVSNLILSELAPLVVGAARRLLRAHRADGDGGEPVLQFQAGYGFKERKHLASVFRLGEGLVGQCALEKERILLTEVPGRLHPDQLRARRVAAAQHHRAADPLRGLGARRDRAGVVRGRSAPTHQSFLDQLTESIGLVLNTVERDVGDREAARAGAVAGAGAAVAAGAAAPVERGPRQAGDAARRQEQRDREQVPGGRGGQAPRRGEGDRALGLLEVQVRVHREHVARAAHAAQQPAGARRAARGQPRRQPDRAPGAVRERDPLLGRATC